MFKRGVTQRGEFARLALEREKARQGWWPFAYTLLGDIENDYSDEDEPLLERLYQSMAAGEGVCKITRRNRFPDLDRQLADDCRERFPEALPLIVHDVGCSSAISSLELFDRLIRERPTEVHASDYFDALYLVRVPTTDWTVVFDATYEPLQLVGRWLVLSARTPAPWRYPVNRLAGRSACRRLLPVARELLRKHLGGDQDVAAVREVSLFHPRAAGRARESAGFLLNRHNLFEPNSVPAHVVRAMNVLTTNHFSEEQVRIGIRACAANLLPGGLLILGRSIDEEDGRARASAYHIGRGGGGAEEVWRSNEGYERPDLVHEAMNPAWKETPTSLEMS